MSYFSSIAKGLGAMVTGGGPAKPTEITQTDDWGIFEVDMTCSGTVPAEPKLGEQLKVVICGEWKQAVLFHDHYYKVEFYGTQLIDGVWYYDEADGSQTLPIEPGPWRYEHVFDLP